MRRRKKLADAGLPFLLWQLGLDSGETIARRLQMMASSTCSPAEYQRMMLEKMKAAQQMGAAMLSGDASLTQLLRPWHVGAKRNAKRLRKRR